MGINVWRGRVAAVLFAAMTCMGASGQGSFEEFRKKAEAEFSSFAKKANEDFEAFRRKVNKEYSDMVERAWREMEAVQGVRRPADDKPVPPRTHPGGGAQPVEDEEKPYDDVVVVAPQYVECRVCLRWCHRGHLLQRGKETGEETLIVFKLFVYYHSIACL